MIIPLSEALRVGAVRPFALVRGEGEVLFNCSQDDAVLLRDVSLSEIKACFGRFREEQYDWFVDLMMTPRTAIEPSDLASDGKRKRGTDSQGLIFGLSGAFDSQPRSGRPDVRVWRFLYLRRKNNAQANAILEASRPGGDHAATVAVHHMGVEEQRRYLQAVLCPVDADEVTWLAPLDAAARLGVKVASFLRRAGRQGWAVRNSKDGGTLVAVPGLAFGEHPDARGTSPYEGRPRNFIAELQRAVTRDYGTRMLDAELDGMVAEAGSSAGLVNGLLEMAFAGDEKAVRSGLKRRVPAMFLAYLNRKGLLLLPQRALVYHWFAIGGRPRHCFGESTLAFWDRVVEVSAIADRTSYGDFDILRTLRGLRLTSTFVDERHLSDGLMQAFKDAWPDRTDVGMMVNATFDACISMLGLSASRNEYAIRRPGRIRMDVQGPFAWVRSDDGVQAGQAPVGYKPREALFYWADMFTDVLALIQVKHLNSFIFSAQAFLHYLASLSAPPPTLADVGPRAHIHGDSGGSTFRTWLVQRFPAPSDGSGARAVLDRRTRVLSNVATMFAEHIAHHALPIANPIDMARVKFAGGGRRSKSVRPAMEVEKLDLIRAFNSRDDFAFSKGVKSHYRNVLDPETKRFGPVWYPALAIAIDLLLELPFRSHQVRYLDSGEGDEFVFDPVSRSLKGNPSPLATRGRRQGAIQLVDAGGGALRRPADGNTRILGIFVNTNKTARLGSDEGWVVPWCPPSLEANLRRMSSWSSKYVPVSGPVKARKVSYTDEFGSEEVLGLVPETFPIFRDPINENGQPVSRQLLFKYWVKLLEAVEDAHNATMEPERHVYLTRPCLEGGRQPLYDIHTLRVSGITAMIERGMPPDMVREVVGHASLVMTLYYNKVRALSIFGKLEDYFRGRGITVESLEQLGADRLADAVFNLREADDSEGVRMLRERFGDRGGSWKVFSHGICPGGDCSSGGRYYRNSYHAVAVGACPLCRYRVTGPMFLLGMVTNANILMHRMRTLGEEIAALTTERYALEDAGNRTTTVDGSLELARRSFDDAAGEWSAEYSYIQEAVRRLNDSPGAEGERALVTPMGEAAFGAKVESLPSFALVQSVCEGVEVTAGFQPGAGEATYERDEWLNAVLDANGYGPLLLRLPKALRLKAGNMLGRAFLDLVPESSLEALRAGTEAIDVSPELRAICDRLPSVLGGDADVGLGILRQSVSAPHPRPVVPDSGDPA